MNPNRKRSALIAALVGLIVMTSCSSNQGKTEAPAAAPSAETKSAEPAETIAPAATVASIWTQIEAEQAKLSTVIQNGQLKDVHHLAFGIRDLVVALADKATADSPDSATQFKGMADQVTTMASKLDELGDAGDLSGTQAEYAKLETYLNGIKAMTGGK